MYMNPIQSVIGIVVFVAVVVLLSRSRARISYKFIATGLAMQFVLAILLLKAPIVTDALVAVNRVVILLQQVTLQATQFMFGYLAGGPPPFEISQPDNNFIVAVQILPLILVVGALSALLFHFRILTFVVSLFSKLLRKSFGISGALGFGSASTVFLGTIEAPLIIRPYLSKLSASELLALITCSMATIAGTVIILYSSVLESSLPNALAHMLTASLISVPAALMLSHIFLPGDPAAQLTFELRQSDRTWIEVLMDSIKEGVQMIISIIAIITVLFAFVYLFDALLALIHPTLSTGFLLGQLLRPVMWLLGFDWASAKTAASLMGTKIVLNEFVSYLQLSNIDSFTTRQVMVLAYAMCGFANFGSCGIIIAGLTALVPERRQEIVRFTFYSLLLGNIATLMTGCVVSIVTYF